MGSACSLDMGKKNLTNETVFMDHSTS